MYRARPLASPSAILPQILMRAILITALAGLLAYAAAGSVVAFKVRRSSLTDDPDHDLDLHALLSIVMCWPHDLQSLRGQA